MSYWGSHYSFLHDEKDDVDDDDPDRDLVRIRLTYLQNFEFINVKFQQSEPYFIDQQ